MTATTRTTCCIAGGGPAGVVLGYLLARAGVEVLVLEKHADFLRDFRGDTIHPSTAQLMDELGLGERFAALPLRSSATIGLVTDDGRYTVADFRRTPGRHTLGFLPQWDFLNFMTEQGRRYDGFEVRMRAEVVDLLRSHGRVTGVRGRDEHGELFDVTADLVVAADGRDSRVRSAADLELVSYGAPIDVLWFRIGRDADDPDTAFGRLSTGNLLVLIDRGDSWQVGYLIPKDGLATLRERGLEAFRRRIAELAPFLGERTAQIASWDDVKLLRVQINRLRRWWRPGLLCIGDAAHAMSPVGGVGINLAVQDAVAAARILAEPLRNGRLSDAHLARVQRRRMVPTAVTQRVQRVVQDWLLTRVVSGDVSGRAPLALRVLDRVPALQALPAWVIGHGVLPEHAPPAR
ncbi:MAG TPA: FAD-dependent oxidoreductase [Euzebyales bacterium]|nr:FAD-dependent oxidoreductase [Euzebyales bacterium]